MSFEIGATVRLKSGGPLMTVDRTSEEGLDADFVSCTWFDDATLHAGIFRVVTLTPAKAQPAAPAGRRRS